MGRYVLLAPVEIQLPLMDLPTVLGAALHSPTPAQTTERGQAALSNTPQLAVHQVTVTIHPYTYCLPRQGSRTLKLEHQDSIATGVCVFGESLRRLSATTLFTVGSDFTTYHQQHQHQQHQQHQQLLNCQNQIREVAPFRVAFHLLRQVVGLLTLQLR